MRNQIPNDYFDGHFRMPTSKNEKVVYKTPSRKQWRRTDNQINSIAGMKPNRITDYFFATVPSQDQGTDTIVKRWMLRTLKEKSGLTYGQLAILLNVSSQKLRRWLKPGKDDFENLPIEYKTLEQAGKKCINSNWFPGCPDW